MPNQVSEQSVGRMAEGARKAGAARKAKCLQDYYRSPKTCKHCGCTLPYEKRTNVFCSSSCSASYNNRPRTEPKLCKQCGKEIKSKYHRSVQFCSYSCFHTDQWDERKREIARLGIVGECRIAKRYLIETEGHACKICEGTTWNEQPIPLVLDHINGNPDDWRVENLRLICPNCDAQTPTYKSKNRGNGRHSRRQRYKEGKSY